MDQAEMLNDLAERMKRMQLKAREKASKQGRSTGLRRGFHAKGTGVRAKFHINPNIPKHLQVGLFQPNAEYDTLVRFSNARSEVLGDLAKDQRGAAIRVKAVQGKSLAPNDYSDIQDFLMTNTPISFARSPIQFIEVGEILLDGLPKVVPSLIGIYGFKEASRILRVFLAPIISFQPLQMNQYWSRTSFQFGERAIRFLIRPSEGSKTLSSAQQLMGVLRSVFQGIPKKEVYFREKLMEALKENNLRFDFCIQLFVDEKKTPIEDAFIEWKESDSPSIPIAVLNIPRQDYDDQLQRDVENMAFNPWHTKEFAPLGLINLARKKVYDASAGNRGSSLQPYK